MRGDGKIMFDLCGFTLCDFFLEHNYQLLNKSRNTYIVKYLFNEFLGNSDFFFLIHLYFLMIKVELGFSLSGSYVKFCQEIVYLLIRHTALIILKQFH